MKQRFTQEPMIGLLREAGAPGSEIRTTDRWHNIAKTTFFRWRNSYGRLDASVACWRMRPEAGSAKLEEPVSEKWLAIEPQREFAWDTVAPAARTTQTPGVALPLPWRSP